MRPGVHNVVQGQDLAAGMPSTREWDEVLSAQRTQVVALHRLLFAHPASSSAYNAENAWKGRRPPDTDDLARDPDIAPLTPTPMTPVGIASASSTMIPNAACPRALRRSRRLPPPVFGTCRSWHRLPHPRTHGWALARKGQPCCQVSWRLPREADCKRRTVDPKLERSDEVTPATHFGAS